MAGELTTTNYGWVKPTVGSSTDAWGGYLNTDLDGINSTVKSVSNAVPLASSTTPAMDGTATIGVGTTFARADHVHPTDTSRAPLASPAFTGTPSMPTGTTGVTQTPGTNNTTLATTAFVGALPVAINDNRIINGNFAVNQRAQVSGTALVAAAYGHDRWKAGASGCTYTFTAALPDTTITITANSLTQIIEAGVIEGGVYTLSWTGTAQARVYQGAPTGSYAASPVTTASLTAGTNTIVEFNAGTVTRVKFEIGSIVTSYNRQSVAKSLADCQRYYQKISGDVSASLLMQTWAGAAAQALSITVGYQAMRAAPTGTVVGSPSLGNSAGPVSVYPGLQSMGIQITATAIGAASFNFGTSASVTLNAEL